MDRPYSSKVRKSQGHPNDKFEASGEAKASLFGQSKKRTTSSFAGNALKKNGEITKRKTLVSGVDEASYDNTSADHTEKRDNSTTPANKKPLTPSIKTPIYPCSLLQHRITSCSVRRKPLSEPLVKTLPRSLPVRAPPVGAVVKASTKWDSRPSTTKRSSNTKVKSLPPSSSDTKKQSSQNKTIQQSINATVKNTKKVTVTQETPLLQENSSTITDDTTLIQPHPRIDDVSEDNEKTITVEKKCVQPILSSSVVKRICSARGRGIVNPPSKHDETCDDEDSDNEYEEDYEDESDGSLSESEGEEKDQRSQAASSADDDQHSSPVSTGQQHSSQSPEGTDDECQSAVEENETNSPQEEVPSPVNCSSSTNMAACNSAAGGAVKRKIPLYRRKSVFPLFSSIMDMPNLCSLQKLSRETPVHTAAPPTESTNDEDKQTTLAALDEMREQLKVIASASAPGDDPDDQPNVSSSKKDKVDIYYDMICRFDYTPLKPIADDLILLHTDLPPTEVCPTLNRSPSFIGVQNQDDGLLSGRNSPKLDIPHNRYCGYKIRQHPLAKYTLKMEKPVKEEQKCSTVSGEGGVAVQVAIKQTKATEHQQVGEQVEDHPSVSGEEEVYSCSSSNGSETSVGNEKQDNVETEHQQVGEQVEGHPVISGDEEVTSSNSSSNKETSDGSGSQDSMNDSGSQDSKDDSGSQDSKDDVEVYTPEALAAKFGNSVKMESETSSKKEKKRKVVSKYNSYEKWYAKKVAQEKAAPQPLPVLRHSSYMDAYRKKIYLEKVHKCYSAPLKLPVRYKTSHTQFSKKSALPPIKVNQQQQQQHTVCRVPTPPTEAPPTSGPLMAARNIRRKQYQKKSVQEAVKLVPAHLNYMLDSPQKCLDYVENLEKVKRKQQYSESLRQKHLMTWANKRQHCTKAQP
ncbi:dentin sialophosphoprotein-like isoform X2 [Dysidea avara]|uniref:dentin sialophosphoprotein-like isoform X2 n=1 Tax=Dysidea avara TaxID=196820 RepID=UPI00331D4FF3